MFTHMGDYFYANISDLTVGSSAELQVKCDYCGKEFTMKYIQYKKCISITNKIACSNNECMQLKAKESVMIKYGGNVNSDINVVNKRKKTNIERYGCENVFGSDEIKAKIIKTNLERYGVPYTQQCESVRQKTRNTCLERYGVEDYVRLFAGKFIKENSPVWKGGVEYSRVERATHEYVEWRNSVYCRDGFRCQVCGAMHCKLNAHHIMNWCDNEDLRYDIDNGITMCEKCHILFHRIYGKRNNTKEQLNEFLNADEKIC